MNVGEIGSFTFQALLIQLTTSIALVKIATTAVDLLAIHLLPRHSFIIWLITIIIITIICCDINFNNRRVLYKNAKYEKTDDFGDLTKVKSSDSETPSIELAR